MRSHFSILKVFCISLGMMSCASRQGAETFDFNKSLEERIAKNLSKRQELVQGNPVYLGLVTELKHGQDLLKDHKPKEAFTSFDKILRDERYSNYPEYSYAKYYLGATLYELGADYGSLLYFVDIVEKEPVRDHTHESLKRAIGIAQKLKDDELILYVASTIPPEKVPLSLREEFRYFIAKDLYQKGNLEKSVKLLHAIPHRNRLYLAAQYLLGAIATKQKNLQEAISYFRTISDARSPVEYYENEKIRQLGNLALGRIFYELKNYPLSIVYYKKVKADGDFFPQALYESSWGLFKLHKFNEALAVLHSMQSPFFEQIYFLKSYLLSGAIFLELCLYDDAVRNLLSIEKQFKELGNQIDRFAKQARSPQEYYPLLSSKIRSPEGAEKYAFRQLFNLASANRDFLAVHRYLERLLSEQKILASLQVPRADLLARLLQQKSSDLTIKGSWLAGQKLKLTRELIAEFSDLKDFLRYEVISAERKILQTRSLRLAPPVLTDADLIRPEFTESLKETIVWWNYNGEYWQDEIGSYFYTLKSICKESQEKAK